jgi:hypothetical protein
LELKTITLLIDRSRSSWPESSKFFLKGFLNSLISHKDNVEGIEWIHLIYFERDQLYDVGKYILRYLESNFIELIISQFGKSKYLGTMPMCAFLKLIDKTVNLREQLIVVASDFRTTVKLDEDLKCAAILAKRFTDLIKEDSLGKIYLVILPGRTSGSLKPLETFVSEIGGRVTIIGDHISEISVGNNFTSILKFYIMPGAGSPIASSIIELNAAELARILLER